MLKKYKKLEELVAQKQGQQSNDIYMPVLTLIRYFAMLTNLLLIEYLIKLQIPLY